MPDGIEVVKIHYIETFKKLFLQIHRNQLNLIQASLGNGESSSFD